MLAKQLKDMIAQLGDNDIVCVGEVGDEYGRHDNEIVRIETRQCGFDSNNQYKVLATRPYNSNGALKFWR